MDAYTQYILQLTNARADELRREAGEYAMSRAARTRRGPVWRRMRPLFTRRPRPAMPAEMPAPEIDLA